ncbi:MAG: hypothetical protein MHM6MM_005685 [Cercozoa sp. M6MM]
MMFGGMPGMPGQMPPPDNSPEWWKTTKKIASTTLSWATFVLHYVSVPATVYYCATKYQLPASTLVEITRPRTSPAIFEAMQTQQ